MESTVIHTCHTTKIPDSLDPALTKKTYYHLPNHLAMDGKLFFKAIGTGGGIWVLQVPKREEVDSIIELFHSPCFAGHFAINTIGYSWSQTSLGL